ncbi:MAG TPA: GDP-mannose 4,6-dehydratase [Polyangiaceae bacterium]|nr:GDP-mannose 4,6-dehydratase [Polyangiaceae bacterium]
MLPSSARTFLVTGAAGFIGSHTAIRLLERGDHVVGLDNFNDYYAPSRKRANLEDVHATARTSGTFTFVEGDIRDRALLAELFQSHALSGVAHLAAMAGVRSSVENPWLYYDCNLTGTLNLLDAAHRYNNPNFVFASTSSAYGNTKLIPFVETDTADRPLAPYPASKRAAELLGHSYHHIQGMDFTALRFFTVYGPRGRPDMMTYKIFEAIRTGVPMPLFNGGNMHRDWTFVGDVVSGVVAALDTRLGYEVINIGRGEPVLVADYIASIEQLAAKKAPFKSEPMMKADVDFTFANIDKAKALLGYVPRISVQEGVRSSYEWYRSAVGDPPA